MRRSLGLRSLACSWPCHSSLDSRFPSSSSKTAHQETAAEVPEGVEPSNRVLQTQCHARERNQMK